MLVFIRTYSFSFVLFSFVMLDSVSKSGNNSFCLELKQKKNKLRQRYTQEWRKWIDHELFKCDNCRIKALCRSWHYFYCPLCLRLLQLLKFFSWQASTIRTKEINRINYLSTLPFILVSFTAYEWCAPITVARHT